MADKNVDGLGMDRAGFVVGLSGSLLALLPFKEDAVKITLPLFGWTPSIYDLAGILLGLLIASAYFAGLNQIRFGIPSLLKYRWLRVFDIIAQVFYVLAFALPLVVCAGWAVSALVGSIAQLRQFAEAAASFASALASITSLAVSIWSWRSAKIAASDAVEDAQAKSAIKSEESYQVGDYRIFVMQLFQRVIVALEGTLVQREGTSARSLTGLRALEAARSLKILSPSEMEILDQLRRLRNEIAHNVNGVVISREDADALQAKVHPILQKLDLDRQAK
jgi:hypothetical protein